MQSAFFQRILKLHVVLELLLVILAGLYASQNYNNSDTNLVLTGLESQWLTSSAYITSDTFHRDGTLPLWDSWIGHGEPTVENPFSFMLNPLSTLPVLAFGAENGIKFSIILYVVFAGLGGWLLGFMLHLKGLARLFLALICIGRGNIPAELGYGYYQLSVTQIYFPWVSAATLALARFKSRRWPIVLLPILLTLLFWAGNIYYMLPALMMVGLLSAVFAIRVDKRRLQIDWMLVRRVGLALMLTVGLAAATLLPIYAHQQYIGGHPDEDPSTVYEDPAIAGAEFFTSQILYPNEVWSETYFSFVLPFWFAVLILILLPITYPRLHRLADAQQHSRVYLAGAFLILFFFTWGTKTNPLITWAYATLPLIGQWRILSRMLTVSAFWIAVLASMRVDGLWRALVSERRLNTWLASSFKHAAPMMHRAAAAVLIVASALAVVQVLGNWFLFPALGAKDPDVQACIDWLHRTQPNANVSVFGNDYFQVGTYIHDHVRFTHINADFELSGLPSPDSRIDLRDNPPAYNLLGDQILYMPSPYDDAGRQNAPEYLITANTAERRFWLAHGYQTVTSPLNPTLTQGNAPFTCLLSNPTSLSYAFTVPLDRLQTDPLPPSVTTPIGLMNREDGRVGLVLNGDAEKPLMVVVQELAWPGWKVSVDDVPAQIESVGQMIGVMLPAGQTAHRVLFVYDPPLLKIGFAITLSTALVCALYLLHAERLLFDRRKPLLIAG